MTNQGGKETRFEYTFLRYKQTVVSVHESQPRTLSPRRDNKNETRLEYTSLPTLQQNSVAQQISASFPPSSQVHTLSWAFLTCPWTSHDDLLAWSRVRRLSWQYERQQGGRRWVTGYRLRKWPSGGVLVPLRFPVPLSSSRT